MTDLPFMKLYWQDFLADTDHLSLSELGYYARLLGKMWLSPDDTVSPEIADRIGRQPLDFYPEAVFRLLTKTDGGEWSQKRLKLVKDEAREAYEKRAEAGRKGGSSKGKARSKQCLSNAKAMHKQPEPEPEEISKDISYTADFETFWTEYPARQNSSKRKAFSAWQARLREGATPAEIVHGARCYAAWCAATHTSGRFVAQHTTWLNQARYEEYRGRTASLVVAEARAAECQNGGGKRSVRDEADEASRRFVARGGLSGPH